MNENIVNIEGVFLTPKAIESLKALQDDNNEILSSFREILANSVEHICMDMDGSNMKEKCDLIESLSFIRRYLQEIMKP